jgi:hypothetical protein
MHQDFIVDTARRERGELRPFVRRERFNRLDQTYRSYGNQIFHIFPGIIEFFDDMNKNRCNSRFAAVMGNPKR